MCPKLIELLSWNGLTVHVWCFMLVRASTKTFVSRIHIRQPSPKTAKNLRQPKNSLAGSLVSRGITVVILANKHHHLAIIYSTVFFDEIHATIYNNISIYGSNSRTFSLSAFPYHFLCRSYCAYFRLLLTISLTFPSFNFPVPQTDFHGH